jgi:hypothetical protein
MPLGPQPPIPLYPWGRCPCDLCPQAGHCRAHLEACAAFALYLEGATQERWSAVAREPQRELFVSLLTRQVDRPRRARSQRAPN